LLKSLPVKKKLLKKKLMLPPLNEVANEIELLDQLQILLSLKLAQVGRKFESRYITVVLYECFR